MQSLVFLNTVIGHLYRRRTPNLLANFTASNGKRFLFQESELLYHNCSYIGISQQSTLLGNTGCGLHETLQRRCHLFSSNFLGKRSEMAQDNSAT